MPRNDYDWLFREGHLIVISVRYIDTDPLKNINNVF